MTTLKAIRFFTNTVKANIERYTLASVHVHIIDGTMLGVEFDDQHHTRILQALREGFDQAPELYSMRVLEEYEKQIMKKFFRLHE